MARIPVKPGIEWIQADNTDLTGDFLKILSQNDINQEERWIYEFDLKKYIVPVIGGTVSFVPSSGGNTTNLNEFVVDSNADVWFIDINGDALQLGGAGGGGGSVISVGLAAPTQFTVSGSPVTSTGTLTFAWNNVNANHFLGGPTTGAAAQPTFRQLVTNDLTDGIITFPKIQNISQNRILGRHDTIGTGVIQQMIPIAPLRTNPSIAAVEIYSGSAGILFGRRTGTAGTADIITLGTGLSMSGTVLSATGASGTVTSVGLSPPNFITVTGSPITTSGTFNLTWQNQTAHHFFLGPNGGAPAQPTFRALVTNDLPNGVVTYAKIQNVSPLRLLGRYSFTTGQVEEIQLGANLSFSGNTLIASTGGSGSNWTLNTGNLYPISTATNVAIGKNTQVSTSLKLEVEGNTYISSETYAGGLLDLSALGRGRLNVRSDIGLGNNLGISLFAANGNTHQLTGLFNSAIFGKIENRSSGMVIAGIATNSSSGAIQISGIENTTDTTSGMPSISINGSVRSGTFSTAKTGKGVILRVGSFGAWDFHADGFLRLPGMGNANTGISAGTGSPEGVRTAGVGSLYLRTNGTPGNTLYIKESGTGNTGWVAK